MGVPNQNDGSIERADLDGKNRTTIVPQGGTFTPKQLHLEKASGKLYWCDREGMRVMRANLDGSQHRNPRSDRSGRRSGLAAMPRSGASESRSIPSADRSTGRRKGPDDAGLGRIFRANIDIPEGETADNRTDIEVFCDNLPEPIDLELDLDTSRPLLDRPRRSAARQHGEPGADRRGSQDSHARNRVDPFDGGNRHCLGCSRAIGCF